MENNTVADNLYHLDIVRGYSKLNDSLLDYLKPKLEGYVLDIGGNGGALLLEYKGKGVCLDASSNLVAVAKSRGLEAVHGDACNLPFKDKTFDTVVLSCVLEQIEDYDKALKEAIRVCKGKVIGINPIPGSRWGVIGGYVKSIIHPAIMLVNYKAKIKVIDDERYFFCI